MPAQGTDFSYSAKVGKSEVRGNRLSCSSSLFTIAFDFLFSFLSNFYYCGWTAKSAITPDTPVCGVILGLSTTLCVRSLWVKPTGFKSLAFHIGDLATAYFCFCCFSNLSNTLKKPYLSFVKLLLSVTRSLLKFLPRFFQKACGFQRQSLWSLTAVSETPYPESSGEGHEPACV